MQKRVFACDPKSRKVLKIIGSKLFQKLWVSNRKPKSDQCNSIFFYSQVARAFFVGRNCLMGNARIKPERLAEKLSLIREQLELTQLEMAEKLSGEKITLRKSDISRYESGTREPPLIVLLYYARLANTTIDILADDDVDLLL